METVNPILPGFNADPAILRHGDDYYIVTSTFEWFPGMSVYHSRDLSNWTHVANALTKPSQLDLRGLPDSAGAWAPDLTYSAASGRFYLAFTKMKRMSPTFFDLDNYVVWADHPLGPWSDAIYLNSSGFDPAFHHDEKGRSWVANLSWEHRQGYPHPGFIVLQEYSEKEQRLLGEPVTIYEGNRHFGCLEGPRIYRIGEYYYLLTAEGGTGYGHAVLVLRSTSLRGPYEPSPHNPLLTSRKNPRPRGLDYDADYLKPRFYNPEVELQKAGHGALVTTPNGDWYLTHLCARPLRPFLRSTLGRETGIQRLEWTEDGWPRVSGGGVHPRVQVSINLPAHGPSGAKEVLAGERTDFGEVSLIPPIYHALRVPIEESWASLHRAPGRLSLRGRDSLYSYDIQSLIGRRIQHFNFRAETELTFWPRHYQEMAGLICLFSTRTWYYLRLYLSESFGVPTLGIMSSKNENPEELLEHRVPLRALRSAVTPSVRLRVEAEETTLRFYFAVPGSSAEAGWTEIGPELDATVLADEFSDQGAGAFSGAFVGICAQDLRDKASWAEFGYFEYKGT